jgi:hypothetical protein
MRLNYKLLIAQAIIGYVFVLALNYVVGILKSFFNILGMLLKVNPKIYFFLDLIPEFLILVFWILLIFVFLKGFQWSEVLSNEITRKLAIKFGFTAIILFLLLFGLRFLESKIWVNNTELGLDHNLILLKGNIFSLLNFLEVIIIVIGFVRIIKK